VRRNTFLSPTYTRYHGKIFVTLANRRQGFVHPCCIDIFCHSLWETTKMWWCFVDSGSLYPISIAFLRSEFHERRPRYVL